MTLFVAPAGGGKVSDELEMRIKAYFEDKRMLSQIVEVADVDYVAIRVTVVIGIESYYVRDDVVAAVRAAAADVLAFERVDFGQTIYLGNFYEAAQSVTGVAFVTVTEFRLQRAGQQPEQPDVEPSGRIILQPNEIPVPCTDADYGSGIRIRIETAGG